MKKIINKYLDFYHKGDNPFYFSLIGPLVMGSIHLIASITHFDWIVVNYCIFFYLMVLSLTWQWSIEKFNLRINNYLAGIISIIFIIAPMMSSFVLTILYRDSPHYLYEWLVYAYALYGTIKMVFAIRKLIRKDKTNKEYVVSFLGMISALYTLQMMEFRLIMFASDGSDKDAMYIMQLMTQGAIFIFVIFVIILLVMKLIKNKKNLDLKR